MTEQQTRGAMSQDSKENTETKDERTSFAAKKQREFLAQYTKVILTCDLEDHITSLPAELHLKIFENLDDDAGAAACLGLTCKTFYPIYRARHKRVNLFSFTGCARCIAGGHARRGPTCRLLYILLMDWMGPGYIYQRQSKIFVKREQLEHLDWKEKAAKRKEERAKKRVERRLRWRAEEFARLFM